MPIDTPYNRMVANQYNEMNRAKIAHEMATYQTVMPSPAGAFTNGYEPVVGSGVGVYHKGDGDRIVGSGNARGGCNECYGYGNARGGSNLGLQPDVRVALALGAGLRGNRTSKHGCLDRHDEFNNSGKSHCPKGHEVCSCGGRRGGPSTYTARGGKGFKAPPKKAPPKKAPPKKTAPKKEEPKPRSWSEFGSQAVKGVEEGVKGIEKAVELGQKVAPYVEKAPEMAKSAFNTVKGWFGKGNARGGRRGVDKKNTHAEKVRGVAASGNARGDVTHRELLIASRKQDKERKEKIKKDNQKFIEQNKKTASGNARGNARAVVVKKVMKDKGLSMIDASKYVKAHNLY